MFTFFSQASAGLDGFLLGASLIVAIGAQNLFVLRQGLKQRFVFAVALTCAIIDAVLIVIGVGGVGTMIAASPILTKGAAWGGALFLIIYGALALKAAIKPEETIISANGESAETLGRVLTTVFAFSLLNPHVYLDTVVILGGLGAQYAPSERITFATGACIASFVWFFALAYSARALAPVFGKPSAQRGLDLFVFAVMWTIAAGLIWNELGN